MVDELTKKKVLDLTSGLVAAFVSNNPIRAEDLPDLIVSLHYKLTELGKSELEQVRPEPAVPIKKSVTDDHIICLEDGQKLKMLKRYLRTRYDLSPEEYRSRWGLPADYPMVDPEYARRRSKFAKEIGLGKTGRVSTG